MTAQALQQHNEIAPIDTLAKHGKTFYWASFLLGKPTAYQAAELYQYCRTVDDIADDCGQDIATKRAMLEAQRRMIENGTYDDWPLLQRLITQHNIPPAAIAELINGMLSDTDDVLFNTDRELLRYCYRAAGTVGLMMCPILGCDNRQAFYHAIDLGMAMQLTNICRDVQEDAHQGRRYLPIPISACELTAPDDAIKQRVSNEIERLLRLADQYYASGLQGLRYLPARHRPAIYNAATIYRKIGDKLLQNIAWWHGRCFVSPTEKALTTLKTIPDMCKTLIGSQADVAHRAELHISLEGLPYVNQTH